MVHWLVSVIDWVPIMACVLVAMLGPHAVGSGDLT